jgi:hypothetical protein
MLTGLIKRRPNPRWLLLLVPALALLTLSCFDNYTQVTLVNSALDPFHVDGGKRLEPGESAVVDRLKHGSIATITLEREGSTRATLTLTSSYDPEEQEQQEVTITVTENPYWVFHATSSNSMISVSVQ